MASMAPLPECVRHTSRLACLQLSFMARQVKWSARERVSGGDDDAASVLELPFIGRALHVPDLQLRNLFFGFIDSNLRNLCAVELPSPLDGTASPQVLHEWRGFFDARKCWSLMDSITAACFTWGPTGSASLNCSVSATESRDRAVSMS